MGDGRERRGADIGSPSQRGKRGRMTADCGRVQSWQARPLNAHLQTAIEIITLFTYCRRQKLLN
jgi:hypothetical protein